MTIDNDMVRCDAPTCHAEAHIADMVNEGSLWWSLVPGDRANIPIRHACSESHIPAVLGVPQ